MSGTDRWRDDPQDVPHDEMDPETRALVERARVLPREAPPTRDLWLGIRHRIEAGPEPSEGLRERLQRWLAAPLQVPAWAASAALVLLVATSIGTGLWMQTPALSLDDPVAVRQLADSLRERDGTGAVRQGLQDLLESRRAQLPPDVVASLEINLAQIDRAIAEIHLAFERNPDNPALQFLLAEAYRREAALLEQLEWWTRAPEEARS